MLSTRPEFCSQVLHAYKFFAHPINIYQRHGVIKFYVLTIKGKSQDIPWPLCRASIVVGPAKEGIQKNLQ